MQTIQINVCITTLDNSMHHSRVANRVGEDARPRQSARTDLLSPFREEYLMEPATLLPGTCLVLARIRRQNRVPDARQIFVRDRSSSNR